MFLQTARVFIIRAHLPKIYTISLFQVNIEDANIMNKPQDSLTSDFCQAGRGFIMGCADAVPGVSGGTMALLLGIYERLIAAISHFDLNLVALLRQRRWRDAATHCDLRFLIALGLGIAIGLGGLATMMKHLIKNYEVWTFSVFFGLILASVVLVARQMKWRDSIARSFAQIVLVIPGAIFAYWLVGLQALGGGDPTYFFLFLCGSIAICAMILPGISGAFILLILGQYHFVIHQISDAVHLKFSTEMLLVLASFGAGAIIGLAIFSRFLRWLLSVAHGPTLAILCGFMIGSLRRIWPFKSWGETDDLIEANRQLNNYENVWPQTWGNEEIIAAVLAVSACVLVLALETVAVIMKRKREKKEQA